VVGNTNWNHGYLNDDLRFHSNVFSHESRTCRELVKWNGSKPIWDAQANQGIDLSLAGSYSIICLILPGQ
jgi:hypothetical protein